MQARCVLVALCMSVYKILCSAPHSPMSLSQERAARLVRANRDCVRSLVGLRGRRQKRMGLDC